MISSEVRPVVDAIRQALPLEREWQMLNSMPAPLAEIPSDGNAPESYLDFLTVANGFICGPVVLFDANTAPSMQFYAEASDGSAVQLGSDKWFCVGVVSDEPWFVRRSDDSVWLFPDTGVTWWMSDRFDQVSTDLDNFFLDIVCGSQYLTLNGASEGDQWWRLLSMIGRV